APASQQFAISSAIAVSRRLYIITPRCSRVRPSTVSVNVNGLCSVTAVLKVIPSLARNSRIGVYSGKVSYSRKSVKRSITCAQLKYDGVSIPPDSSAADYLKSNRRFPNNIELALKGDAYLANQAVVEQSPEDRDSVRHTSRWIELGQRIVWIGSPVAARLRDFDEAGTQSQRWMAGEVRDGQLLVTQRRHDQDIDLFEDAGHLERDFATQTISLHKIYGRQERRLPKQIGPGVFHLYLQFTEFVVE